MLLHGHTVHHHAVTSLIMQLSEMWAELIK